MGQGGVPDTTKDAGCKVIAITDSYTAPIGQGAEKVIALVSKRNKELNENRLMEMESYLERTGQY